MDLSIEKVTNQKLRDTFAKLGLDTAYAVVKVSDRPDLSDFQCNGALALAKQEKKNPREIAIRIAGELEKDADFAKISIDGPGFINLTLKNEAIAAFLDQIAEDDRFGIAKLEKPKKVVMDFGGPNVAKAMHVGHLRAAVIGESIQRIERFLGNEVISDVHLGDWGTQMGMIIAEIIKQDGNLDKALSYNIDEITEFYKAANLRCKEDENAKEDARQITAALQDGNPEYRRVWQHLREASVSAIKKNYDDLDINFDLWLGESDAHAASAEVVKLAEAKGLSELDEGAHILRLEESNKPKPPVILIKSDGAYGYQITDIATIKDRVEKLGAEEIIYVVDKRQSLHFEQVFEAVSKLEIAPNVKMVHIGFGTVNGSDGKPFKTRDGGVMTLENLIALSKDKVGESMPSPADAPGYDQSYIDNLTAQIAVGAIKFQDLKNSIASGYVFDLEDFAKFEGKTGPYIQYAIARINSIIRKAKDSNISFGRIIISNPEERILALKLLLLNNTVYRAFNEYEPSIISDYAYTLAQIFSSFYNTSPIISAETPQLAASRLQLAKLVRNVLALLLYLLGIEAPEVMLKA